MKYKVLFTAPYMIPFVDRFKPVFDKYGVDLIIPDVHERMEEADLLKYAGQFDGTICGDDRYSGACARGLSAASQGHFQVGDWDRFNRRRSLFPLWDQALPHPERVHPPRRGHGPGLHPGVCPPPALDGQGDEIGQMGKDPRQGAQ